MRKGDKVGCYSKKTDAKKKAMKLRSDGAKIRTVKTKVKVKGKKSMTKYCLVYNGKRKATKKKK